MAWGALLLDDNNIPWYSPESIPILQMDTREINLNSASEATIGSYPAVLSPMFFACCRRARSSGVLDGYVIRRTTKGGETWQAKRNVPASGGSGWGMTLDVRIFGKPQSIAKPAWGIFIADATGKIILTNETIPLKLSGMAGAWGVTTLNDSYTVNGRLMTPAMESGHQMEVAQQVGRPPLMIPTFIGACAHWNGSQTLFSHSIYNGYLGNANRVGIHDGGLAFPYVTY